MKILRIYYLLPPKIGGMEKHIYNLSKIQSEFNDVKIIFNYGEKVNQNDIKVLSLLRLFKIRPLFIGMIIFYLAVIKQLFCKQESFDIIHIHGDWSSLLFIKLLKKLTNSKAVALSLHDQLSKKWTHQKLLPRLVQDVDLIFSTGYDTAKELEILCGRNIIIQPSGINEVFFQEFKKKYENEAFKVITVANLFPKKNIELVLEIAKALKKCKFIIVGDGTQRKILEDKIENENISNVEMPGFKSADEIREYYQQSDCYLLTSFAEGTPTSALEAMACGLPIISSNAGGLGNIVLENENGFIIDDFDKNKYVKKIKLLIGDLGLRKKMFEKNRQLAQNYKWDKVAENITHNMENILNEKS